MGAKTNKKDIAIIGISGKFHKSENITEFWDHLINGEELIHFYSNEELEELGVNPDLILNENYIKAKSFIGDVESFDHSFFGYTKEEASLMDPQTRIMHEQVWIALEDSGYDPFTYRSKIGCFLSSSDNLNWRIHAKLAKNEAVNPFLGDEVANNNSVSTLISYALNLKGPSYHIDTACSSSLVSVHIACRNLLLRECSMVIAGGVSIDTTTDTGYFYEEGMIMSKDGHCKAFDIDSSGVVSGEGAGVVVLKRLEDAISDRDHIYGVIKASSTNNDGKRKVGFTAPSTIGQYECIKLAQQVAGIPSQSISYIEAHGTGTKLGDPVEIEALNKAFNNDTAHSCAIGSVKTNIGHLDVASGIAGLIKTTLAIKHKLFPPSLHYKSPNPEINFESGPFYVNSELKKWESKDESPLIAGVSSLGIGGTNAHVILSEAPKYEKEDEGNIYQLIPYSANTKSSLIRYKNKLEKYIETNNNVNLSDLAYTLKIGRKPFKYRQYIVCKNKVDALNKFNEIDENEPLKIQENQKIVFMFPGQGSQYFEMGKQIYFQNSYYKSIVNEGFQILKDETGEDYSKIIGYTNSENINENLINKTCYTQPLLFLIEYAFAQLLLKGGITPNGMIGHSLGEYTAACISGVFSFEDALKIIIKRAYLMNELEKGSMLSVATPISNINKLIDSNLSVAAINTDDSCVVSGRTEDIDKLVIMLKSKEISFSQLKTSHAFHSHMMDDMLEAYEKELTKIKLSPPNLSFTSCITGKVILEEEVTSPKYWIKNLRETVDFSKGVNSLIENNNTTFIEIGPGKTLSSFLRQNKKNNNNRSTIVGLLKHPKEIIDDNEYLENALGTLWKNGVNLNWKEFSKLETRNRVSAPTYSFDKVIFPARVDLMKEFMDLNLYNSNIETKNSPSDWVYEKGWKEVKHGFIREKEKFDWTVCFLGNDNFSEQLANRLKKNNNNLLFVKQGDSYSEEENGVLVINPSSLEHYEKLQSYIEFKGKGKIIHAWNTDDIKNEISDSIQNIGYFSLINIAKTILQKEEFTKVDLTFLSKDLFNVTGNDDVSPERSTAIAPIRVIPKEFENVTCRCIEFQTKDFKNENQIYENILSKIEEQLNHEIIAIRGSKLWEPFYERVHLPEELLDKDKIEKNGVYIVSGAAGGMGKAVSKFLVEEYDAKLILIGRSALNDGLVNKKENLIEYIQDDLRDASLLKKKIESIQKTSKIKINGVFHTAGVGDYAGLIEDRTSQDCLDVFLPKVEGTQNLFNAITSFSPEFFVLCSSSSAILSPFGQVAYVAANIYQNSFAAANNGITKVVSIMWDSWKETGMAVKANQRHGDTVLEEGISNSEGIELFKYSLHFNSTEFIVSILEFNAQVSHAKDYTLKKALEISNLEANNLEEGIERPQIDSEFKEPKSETEIQLCNLWKSIFGYDSIGVIDGFFELGGDSLKAMTLMKQIHKTFGIEISLGDFFQKSNIEKLALEIDVANEIVSLKTAKKKTDKNNQIRL